MTAFRLPITRRRFLATSAMAAVAATIPVVEAEAEDDVRVTRLPVFVPNLPAALWGVTIAHVTDLHLYEDEPHPAARRALHELPFPSMGTAVRLLASDPCPLPNARAEVERLAALLTRFDARSELCALNADPRPVVGASADLAPHRLAAFLRPVAEILMTHRVVQLVADAQPRIHVACGRRDRLAGINDPRTLNPAARDRFAQRQDAALVAQIANGGEAGAQRLPGVPICLESGQLRALGEAGEQSFVAGAIRA